MSVCGRNKSLHTAPPESHKRFGLVLGTSHISTACELHFYAVCVNYHHTTRQLCLREYPTKGEHKTPWLHNLSTSLPASLDFLLYVLCFVSAHCKSRHSVKHVCLYSTTVSQCVYSKRCWLLFKVSGFTGTVTAFVRVKQGKSFVFVAQ